MTVEYTPEVAREAVERGAAWLDEQCPNWPERIDLEGLDLSDTRACMLGQTADCIAGVADDSQSYFGVLTALNLDWCGSETAAWCQERGFDCPDPADFDEKSTSLLYEVLTLTWREYIRERLEAKAAQS